ncbi:MAG: hypothetical protein ACFFC7_19835 [Candidatus Hermodarchaeota archaeon]
MSEKNEETKTKEVAAVDVAPTKPKFKEIDGKKIPIRMSNKDLEPKPFTKRIVVDGWGTRFHKINMGFRKDQERTAKSRQYSKDMSLCGTVYDFTEEQKVIGYTGIRDSIWKEKDLINKRLVLKAFTEKMNWLATIEELVARECMTSFAAKKNYISFVTMVKDYPYLIDIDKVESGYAAPESFAFRIKNDLEAFSITSRRGLGIDFKVMSSLGNKYVADIDGAKFNMGGKYTVTIFDPELAENNTFVWTLAMFAATIQYHKEMYKKVGQARRLMGQGDYYPKISKMETALRRNPRLRAI